MSKNNKVFEDLFVLEIANNHWGSLERGYKIVEEFGKVVRQNNVKAAIKLQIRDVDNFVHKDFRDRKDIRYTSKTLVTKMTKNIIKSIVLNNIIFASHSKLNLLYHYYNQ